MSCGHALVLADVLAVPRQTPNALMMAQSLSAVAQGILTRRMEAERRLYPSGSVSKDALCEN